MTPSIPVLVGILVGVGCSAPAAASTFEGAIAGRIAAFERLVSSVRVETQQEATSARTGAHAEEASYRALASAMVNTDNAVEVRRAQQRFETMQTAVAGSCADVAASLQADAASAKVGGIMTSIADQERAWASNGGARVSIMAGTQAVRQSHFCSASEAASGLCDAGAHLRFGGVPAGDSDVSPFMLRMNNGVRSYGDIEAQAGMIYMDNLLPMPTIPTQAEAEAMGSAGRIARASAMRELAIISLGRASVGSLIARGLEGGAE